MPYRIHPALVEVIEELDHRLDELKKLDWYEFKDVIWPILEKIVFHVDIDTLPFTAVTSWHREQKANTRDVWQNTLDWPTDVAQRASVQLRFFFFVMTHEDGRMTVRMSFIPGSRTREENVPGYVGVLLRPLVRTLQEYIALDDVRVDLYVAEVWSGTEKGPTRMMEGDLETLRERRNEFDHFIDCAGDRVIAEVENGAKRVPSKLTAGEAEMFQAAFAVSQNKDEFFYPENLDLEVVSKTSRAQVYKTMRTKVDAGNHGVFRLFKSRKTGEPHKLEYRFAPGEDVSWLVILPLG